MDTAARRCEELIDGLTIPRPFDLDEFVQTISHQRGRCIQLVPTSPGEEQQPCGMLISTAHVDYICYARDLPPLQLRHVILHELGHMLLGHGEPRADHDDPTWLVGTDVLTTLMPTLSTTLIQRILGRTVYASPQEQEAELFASLLLVRIDTPASNDGHLSGGCGGGEGDDRLRVRTAWDAYCRLEWLWRRVTDAVPHVRLETPDALTCRADQVGQPEFLLCRRVMEIRDAQLALRPYLPRPMPTWVVKAAHQLHLDGQHADVIAEATKLAAALDACQRGHRAASVHRAVTTTAQPEPACLLAEADWLCRVAAMLGRLSPVDDRRTRAIAAAG